VKHQSRIAVCSRSFSKNTVLREELEARYDFVKFNDDGVNLDGQELVDFLKDCDKAITALERIDGEILKELPRLKAIGKYGVGLDMIDFEAMREHKVKLGWTGGVNRRSVAELVLCYFISLLRLIPFSSSEVIEGRWKQVIGRQLTGKSVGIIGCGHIGKDLIKLLQPFNCRILVNDIVDYPDFYKEYKIETLTKEELIQQSDIVTLHVPLNKSTMNMLDKEKLSLMKHDSILINAARGGLIDENELKNILKENKIAGAALDVFNHEPPEDIELLKLPNIIVTPHIGGSAYEAILAMGMSAIDGLEINKIP